MRPAPGFPIESNTEMGDSWSVDLLCLCALSLIAEAVD